MDKRGAARNVAMKQKRVPRKPNETELNRTEAKRPTYTNTSTGTRYLDLALSPADNKNNSTDTDGISLLDSAVAAGDAAGPRADAPPASPPPDLFGKDQIEKIVRKNRINLDGDGILEFYEQMQSDGWTLYGKPVEKKFIIRVLREWAKRHPEYNLLEEDEEIEDEDDADDAEDEATFELEIYKAMRKWIPEDIRKNPKYEGCKYSLLTWFCPRDELSKGALQTLYGRYPGFIWECWTKNDRESARQNPRFINQFPWAAENNDEGCGFN